jgi:hypothetical protein
MWSEPRATTERGPGTMSLERWTKLATQMLESGVIREPPVDPAACFRDPVALIKGSRGAAAGASS